MAQPAYGISSGYLKELADKKGGVNNSSVGSNPKVNQAGANATTIQCR